MPHPLHDSSAGDPLRDSDVHEPPGARDSGSGSGKSAGGSSLRGSLGILALGDVFRELAEDRRTGTLSVRASDGREKRIFFSRGEIALLSGGQKRRFRLGEALVAGGTVRPEDLDAALAIQREKRGLLGEILVAEGFCSAEHVEAVVRGQLEDEICDVFLWPAPQVEFHRDDRPPDLDRSNVTRLPIPATSLALQALRRLEEWREISVHVRSPREVFLLVDEDALAAADLSDELRSAIARLDGSVSLETVAQASSTGEFTLFGAVARLVAAGAVRGLSAEELGARAQVASGRGDAVHAAVYLERLVELAPTDRARRARLAAALTAADDAERAAEQWRIIADHAERAGVGDEERAALEALLALRPDDADARRRLTSVARRSRSSLVVIALAVLLAGGGALTWYSSRDGSAAVAERIARARALEANGDLAGAFVLLREVIRDAPTAAAAAEVELPLRVRDAPPGLDIRIGGHTRGHTTGLATVVRFSPRELPAEGALTLELVRGDVVVHAEPIPIGELFDRSIRVVLPPLWTYDAGAPLLWPPAQIDGDEPMAWVATSDGRLHALLLRIGRPDPRLPVRSVAACSPPGAIAGEDGETLAILGTSEGEVIGIRARNGTPAFGVPADGLVRVAPVAVPAGGLVVWADATGTLHSRALSDPTIGARHQVAERPIRALAALAPDSLVVVAGDERGQVIALDAATGETRWRFDAGGIVAAIVSAGDRVAIHSVRPAAGRPGEEEARLHVLDAASGEPTPSSLDLDVPSDARGTSLAAAGPLVVIARNGSVSAIASDGAVAWTRPLVELWPEATPDADAIVRLGASRDGRRVHIATDAGDLAELDAVDGSLRWRGSLAEEASPVTGPLELGGTVLVGDAEGRIHGFPTAP